MGLCVSRKYLKPYKSELAVFFGGPGVSVCVSK